MSDLAFATATELATLLERRQLGEVELAQLFLGRLERLGPRYNAVAAVLRERALDEARRAERQRAQGRVRSRLHGLPYGAKDLLAARGAPTTWGAPPYRDQVLDFDAAAVERLQRAGALQAAKLAMVELAGGGGYRYPSASLQGPGRNPWHPDYWAGGSSSGSGAAVAAGLVPLAIGSETSGSIITPAAYCGVTGLRPTYGRVSRYGAMALSWTLDKLGPLARSAADCALALEALAGPDARDPTCTGRRFRWQPLALAELRALRLGYAPADFDELAGEEARPAFAAALAVLRGLGAPLVEAALPTNLPYGAITRTIIGAEGATAFAGLIESEAFETLVDAKQKAGLRAGLQITARDYLEAMRLRTEVQHVFRRLFQEVDVLVSVGRPGPATPVVEPLDSPASAAAPAVLAGRPHSSALIPAGNLAGLPALCLPCGFATMAGGRNKARRQQSPPGSPHGGGPAAAPAQLPVALQLVGRPFAEGVLLSLGDWFQRETAWHRQRPPERIT